MDYIKEKKDSVNGKVTYTKEDLSSVESELEMMKLKNRRSKQRMNEMFRAVRHRSESDRER